jgi:phosphoribosylamine--glycine ligase
MLTAQGPKVLEFNVRFGDPECQPLMLRLQSDLLELLEATIAGRLSDARPVWDSGAAACVVLAARGYPGTFERGKTIRGLADAAALPEVVVFHSGTARRGDEFVTNGGRVLSVAARGADIEEALQRAYAAVEKIHFDGMQFRRDIGRRALPGGRRPI